MPLLSETTPETIATEGQATFSVTVDGWLPAFPLYFPDPRTLKSETLQTLSPNQWVLFAHSEADEFLDLPAGICMLHVEPATGDISSESLPGRYVTSIFELMKAAESNWTSANTQDTAHLRLISIPQHKMDVAWLKATDPSQKDRFFLNDDFKRWGGGIVEFSTGELVEAVKEQQEQLAAMYRQMAAEGHDISLLGG